MAEHAVRVASPAYLERAAIHYLERFSSSVASLRRVLKRKLRRSVEAHGTDPIEGAAWIEAIIAKLQSQGLVDDRRYAENAAASLHRRGASARAIAMRLAAKGIDRDLVTEALSEADDEAGLARRPGGDLAAAAAFARRRRLGPYRPDETRAAMRDKDFASLARAGFSRRIAERVLACADRDEMLELARAEE